MDGPLSAVELRMGCASPDVAETSVLIMRKIRLRLSYDGSNYQGWQVQPNGPTVQAAVEEAIRKLTGHDSMLIAAGRTDSGVHAIGQVAHFVTESTIPALRMRAALQSQLPRDIVVVAAEDVPADFHARYDAKWKRYRYVIDNSGVALPFLQRYAHRVHEELDVAAMHRAGQILVGTHDFRSFESHWPNRPTSVRTVRELSVTRQSGWPVWFHARALESAVDTGAAQDFVCLDIAADGFLYNMVRSIMGTLLEVGRQRWEADQVARILLGQDRASAGATLPPQGLYLMHVEYQ